MWVGSLVVVSAVNLVDMLVVHWEMLKVAQMDENLVDLKA